jgi:hypothetical protein
VGFDNFPSDNPIYGPVAPLDKYIWHELFDDRKWGQGVKDRYGVYCGERRYHLAALADCQDGAPWPF